MEPAKKVDQVPAMQQWQTEFVAVDLRALTQDIARARWAPGEARPRLISRSGFEQKHIHTSQIASM